MNSKQWIALAVLLMCMPLFTGCNKPASQANASSTAVSVPDAVTAPPNVNKPDAVTQPPQAEESAQTKSDVERRTDVEDSGKDQGVSWYTTRDGDGYALHVSGATIPARWMNSVLRFTNKDSNGANLLGRIVSVVVADDVTAIGERAFAGCSALVDVKLGAGVSSMGSQVFFDCQRLYKVSFTSTEVPASALKGNQVVQKVSISGDCTSICKEAFSGCTALRAVEGATEALVQLEDSAFAGCTALNGLPEMPGLRQIGDNAFAKCTAMTEAPNMPRLRLMGEYAFSECTALRSMTFPETLVSIGSYAFQGCSALRDIVFPDWGDMKLCENAFESCTNLSSAVLTKAVYAVGTECFKGCTSLTSLTLDSQDSLGDNLLSGCSNLTVTVKGRMPEAALEGSGAVVEVRFEGNTVVPARAFSGCAALKKLSFNEALPVKTIGEEAFQGCSALGIVDLGEGLESLGSRAFANCTNMQKVTMPRSLKKIGSAVFANIQAFAEDYRTRICFAGSETEWNKVEKPAQKTGVSWNAGITRSDTTTLSITYLNK